VARPEGGARRALAAAALALVAGCAAPPTPAPGGESPARALIVVSLDGYRWDYPELHGAPELLALARDGVRAESLIPSFPSKTYPNHYTLVTGLRPQRHGIVGNTMWDPRWNARFSLADRAAVEDGRWWGGEPIWNTAERQGRIAAASFWPGSEAPVGGRYPSFWGRYDDRVPDADRVDQALAWLDLPAARRPSLVALYFAEPDASGHRFGPAAPETAAAVAHVDALLRRLRDGVAARGLAAGTDLVVVSDHGMTAIAPERSIVLAELVDLADVEIVELSAFGLLRPRPGREAAVFAALDGAHPRLHVFRREEVPARLHYRDHPRIPPIVLWADAGWSLHATAADRERAAANGGRGAHGYDPAERDMHGILVAGGPSFRRGVVVPPVDNVHVYELLCAVLGVEPAPNDGDPAAIRALLR
jgi:predicted AlkP superfamily pyrophosphatase or phosphodiesterase